MGCFSRVAAIWGEARSLITSGAIATPLKIIKHPRATILSQRLHGFLELMVSQVQSPTQADVQYPDSDGQPMANNLERFGKAWGEVSAEKKLPPDGGI